MTTATNDENTPTAQSRTVPIASTLETVAGLPTKVKLYRIAASPYWQVRCFESGKTIKRSTGSTDKREAIKFAKSFYEQIIFNKLNGVAMTKRTRFDNCAKSMMETQSARVARKELSLQSHQNDQYLLDAKILPFLRERDIGEIDYGVLNELLSQLSQAQLSASSILRHMGVIRKVLDHAINHSLLQALPKFPKVQKQDSARGWFNKSEYRKLWSRARALSGKEATLRGKPADGKEKGVVVRKLQFTDELRYMIVFMCNSFIRPTDLKNMQHKHVQIIRSDNTYLRLQLPISKKKDKPIATMAKAVDVYEQLTALHGKSGLAEPDDYVFMPQYRNRTTALRRIEQQFNYLLDDLGMKQGARGEERTLYSLRHTCIMFRLLYGNGIDLLTLARNARTSVEMIERFYASELSGEMNIEALQSRRRPRNNPKKELNIAE